MHLDDDSLFGKAGVPDVFFFSLESGAYDCAIEIDILCPTSCNDLKIYFYYTWFVKVLGPVPLFSNLSRDLFRLILADSQSLSFARCRLL